LMGFVLFVVVEGVLRGLRSMRAEPAAGSAP
jgi:hypothetical protein